MIVLSTFFHASRDLERFLLDARDQFGHATTHWARQSCWSCSSRSGREAEPQAFERALAKLPPGAREFWVV